MKTLVKTLSIFIAGLFTLSFTGHINAQTTQKNTQTQMDSLRVAQNKHPKSFQHTTLDSTGFRNQTFNRHLLFTPQDKNRFNFRDLLLRPQDRRVLMVHPVRDTLAQPDSTKQEK